MTFNKNEVRGQTTDCAGVAEAVLLVYKCAVAHTAVCLLYLRIATALVPGLGDHLRYLIESPRLRSKVQYVMRDTRRTRNKQKNVV